MNAKYCIACNMVHDVAQTCVEALEMKRLIAGEIQSEDKSPDLALDVEAHNLTKKAYAEAWKTLPRHQKIELVAHTKRILKVMAQGNKKG